MRIYSIFLLKTNIGDLKFNFSLGLLLILFCITLHISKKQKKLPIIMRIIESFKFIELKNSIISNTSSNAFQEAYNVLSNREKKHVEWLFLTKKATSEHTLIGIQKCD